MVREVDYLEPADELTEEPEDADGSGSGEGERERLESPSPISSTLSTAIKIMAIVALMIVLALFVKTLIDANSGVRDRKVKKKSFDFNDPEELEENLMEADLDPLLREALEQEEYLWAIRLYYLQILQSLSERRFIQWKKDKTNWEYLGEIEEPLRNTFRQVTQTFDRLWYGSVKLGQAEFEETAPVFERFLERIRAEKVKIPDLS